MPDGQVGGHGHVPGGHQVRVDVVVDERGVLVRAGDAVDPEPTLGVVVAERAPQPGGRDQQVQPGSGLELVVPGRRDVPADRVGDVGVDVERGRARRPVARALLAADRPPRERHPLEPELAGPGSGEVERGVAPEDRVARRARVDVREDRQRVRVHVPERVTVVAATGQSLGRDRAQLGSGGRLDDVEQCEPHRLLERGVAVELDVRAIPDAGEVLALPLQQTLPPRPAGRGEREVDLVAQRRQRSLAGPAVAEELDDPQLLARLELRAHGQTAEVGLALGRGHGALGPLDDVIHPGGHPQAAQARTVDEADPERVVRVVLGDRAGPTAPPPCEGRSTRRRPARSRPTRTGRRSAPARSPARPRTGSRRSTAGRTTPSGSSARERPARPAKSTRPRAAGPRRGGRASACGERASRSGRRMARRRPAGGTPCRW